MTPILSSVDNGWLAAALRVVANSVPEVADEAWALYDSMDFGFYYRPELGDTFGHTLKPAIKWGRKVGLNQS